MFVNGLPLCVYCDRKHEAEELARVRCITAQKTSDAAN
jgi:hypothetical protein